MAAPPRYCPAHRLPPYAYRPGRNPHPTRSPRGHSHGSPPPSPAYLPARDFGANAAYLWGVDLYNRGFFWEAHEAWEAAWHAAAAADPIQAELLRGLIQCAAAALKADVGAAAGARALGRRALAHLAAVTRRAGPAYMGLDLARLSREFARFLDASDRPAPGPPRLVLAIPGAG